MDIIDRSEIQQTDIVSIMERDEKVFLNTFGRRTPICIDKGEGCYLYDLQGKRYLDLIGCIAVNVLGHAHPRLAQAISSQAAHVIHCSNYYYNMPQLELSEKLARLFGDGHVFISNSGAEANEAAIKLARGYFYKKKQPRAKFITASLSFHGRTLATATATGQPQYSAPFAPLPSGFFHVPFNDIEALEAAVDNQTCAVMLELIQGESGVRPADLAYVKRVAELCQETGARLIIDEIQTGMGRTGYFFASELYGIKPDIITLAKGLGGGVPIGAVIANTDTASGFAPGDHGSTFGGNPLACAAACAVLDEYEESDLVGKAGRTGALLQQSLRAMAADTPVIKEVRGAGLMIGIELNKPIALPAKAAMLDSGYLIGSVGTTVLRLLPPLILPDDLIAPFTSDLADCLKRAEKETE